MRKFSQKYKNIVNRQLGLNQLNKNNEKPILQIYEEMKRDKRPVSKKVNNIEIIKLLKTSGRKKKDQSQRESVVD